MARKSVFIIFSSSVLLVLLLGVLGTSAADQKTAVLPADPSTFTGRDADPSQNAASLSYASRSYLTVPELLPDMTVQRWPGELADGYLFVSMFDFAAGLFSTMLILDNEGEPIYYDYNDEIFIDFKQLSDGYLAYATMFGPGRQYTVMGNRYKTARVYRAAPDPDTGQPYLLDPHDLLLLDNGNIILLIHDERIMDLSAYGGSEEAAVIGCIIQELDPAGDVVFQWKSWDHIPITDTYMSLDSDFLRYVHCNSIEVDDDGHLLVSNRNTSDIVKINRQTGEIIWRLGGRHNEFTFLNDRGFNVQHDARRLANGDISLYDNADENNGPSRAVVYRIDEVNKEVEKVSEFVKEPGEHGWIMGNMQHLPNGNFLVGWGRSWAPVLTEYDSTGAKLLEISTPDNVYSYRAFRFRWRGLPEWPPALVARTEPGKITLYFSWNGSTETIAYQVFAGQDPEELAPFARAARTGFESSFTFEPPGPGTWYFNVRPVSKRGEVGPASDTIEVDVFAEMNYAPLIVAP